MIHPVLYSTILGENYKKVHALKNTLEALRKVKKQRYYHGYGFIYVYKRLPNVGHNKSLR